MIKHQDKQREELHKLLDEVPEERLHEVEALLKEVLDDKLQHALDPEVYGFWLNDEDDIYEREYRDKIWNKQYAHTAPLRGFFHVSSVHSLTFTYDTWSFEPLCVLPSPVIQAKRGVPYSLLSFGDRLETDKRKRYVGNEIEESSRTDFLRQFGSVNNRTFLYPCDANKLFPKDNRIMKFKCLLWRL